MWAESRLMRVRRGGWHIGSKASFDADARSTAVALALAVKPSQESWGSRDLGSLDEKVAAKNPSSELPVAPLGRAISDHSEFS
jgi:hypothetical protein